MWQKLMRRVDVHVQMSPPQVGHCHANWCYQAKAQAGRAAAQLCLQGQSAAPT